MPGPTPTYRVKFNGQYLPGYVQSEDIPLSMRNSVVEILNRDGGAFYQNGAAFRTLTLSFRILTRLDNVTGLVHLGDCLEQYRDALRIVSRVPSASTLFLGATNHWLVARFKNAENPLAAPDHRAINYRMDFDVTPYFLGPAVEVTDAISGNDTIVLNIGDTRRTYPVIRIPTAITGITISHTPSGKSFTLNGSHAQAVNVDCAALTVKNADGTNNIVLLTSGPDFGISHSAGSGSFTLDITGVTGSGDVAVTMNPRLER